MATLLLRVLLLLALVPGALAQAAPRPPADTTRWVDADDTPWLRAIRSLPASHERSLAYWQAQAPAHPQPTLLDIALLDRLAEAEATHDVAAAYPLHLAVMRLAQQLPYPQVRAEALLHLADYHAQLARYDSAAHYLPAAERQFRLDRNLGGVVRCVLRLGRIAGQQGRYAASLAYYQQALELAATGNTRRYHTDAQIQLGTLYGRVGDYAEARRYLLAAQQAAAHYNYPDRTNLALGELGEIERQQRHWEVARNYFTRSIAISHQIKEMPHALDRQLSLALLREDQAQYPAAAAEGRQVLAQAQAARLPLLVPLAQALLARLALRAGQVPAAIAYGHQSLAGSQQARLLLGVSEASAVLAEAYTRQRAYGPALAALRQYNAAHDSLLGDNTRRRTALLQYNHERQQQMAQIELLTQQNRLAAQAGELARLRTRQQLAGTTGAATLLVLLVGGAFWQYRRRAAQHQRAQAAALRQRLAADLHDDVGNLLTQISLQSDLLRETNPQSPPLLLSNLQALSDTSRRATRQMADVVWGLHTAPDSLPALLLRMREHAYQVLPPAGLAIDFGVTPEVSALHPSAEVSQGLYLIYKECLHNAVKHAKGASCVTVRLSHEAGQLCLHVQDDAPGPAPAASRPGGQGLRNMRQRAEAVGGTFQVATGVAGFGVQVCLPV